MIRSIKTHEFSNAVESTSGVTIVDFFATWCGPCKMLSPIFEGLQNEMQDKATFVKVDIDQSLELAQKFQVSSVPTMIIFKDGKPVERLVGFMPKDSLKAKVEAHL